MKITEAMRWKKAMEMIEEETADAQSLDPKRDWKRSYEAVVRVYKLAHTIRSPGCRENHLEWCMRIDTAIKADRRAKREP